MVEASELLVWSALDACWLESKLSNREDLRKGGGKKEFGDER